MVAQCCQVFESPKDQNFSAKRPEKTKNVKNIEICVNRKESRFLAFNTGVYLGCDVQAHHISNKLENCKIYCIDRLGQVA